MVDYRSDQFAFGSISYEMATGKRAFQKKTAVDTLSAILNEEPESVATLNPATPVPMRWIVERCLAKEPDGRYASTKDLARELGGLRDHLSEASGIAMLEPGARRRPSSKQALGIALAAMALLGGGYLIANLRSRPVGLLRFQKVTFQRGTVHRGRFAPDNQTVVYAMISVGDDAKLPELYTSRVGSLDARPLGLPPADILSISSSGQLAICLPPPDALRIFGMGTLAEVSLSGGAPRQLLEGVSGADWSPDGRELAVTHKVDDKSQLEFPIGRILYKAAGDLSSPRVSPDGTTVALLEYEPGKPNRLLLVDRKGQVRTLLERGEGHVAWSPHGDEVWWSRSKDAYIAESTEVHAVDIRGHDRRVATLGGDFFLHDVSRDGRVLFERNDERYDVIASLPGQTEKSLEWLDQSVPVALSSDNRTLLFTDRGDAAGTITAVYIRGTDGSPAVRLGEGVAKALSPDGRWALAGRGAASDRLVLLPVGVGQESILPTGSLVFNRFADWAAFHPDGKSVLFSAIEPTPCFPLLISPTAPCLARKVTIRWVSFQSTGPQKPFRTVARLPQNVFPVHWAADGKSVLIGD